MPKSQGTKKAGGKRKSKSVLTVRKIAKKIPPIGPIIAERNALRRDKGILQLEVGQLEAKVRKLEDYIINPPSPHPPTNPKKFVPRTIPKKGQKYREYIAGCIYGDTYPKVKGVPKDGLFLQVGLGRYGDGKFGPNWVAVDLYDPSPAVDYNYDVQNLPKSWSNKFDLVQCNAIYEHIPYPQKATDQLFRVTKPGGYVYVELPFWQKYHTGGDSTIGDKYGFGGDYWRATVEGLRVWMSAFDEVSCGWANEGVVFFFGRKPTKQTKSRAKK